MPASACASAAAAVLLAGISWEGMDTAAAALHFDMPDLQATQFIILVLGCPHNISLVCLALG